MGIKQYFSQFWFAYSLIALLGTILGISFAAFEHYEMLICFVFPYFFALLIVISFLMLNKISYKKKWVFIVLTFLRYFLLVFGMLIPALIINQINGNYLFLIYAGFIMVFVYLMFILSMIKIGKKES